MKPGPLHDPTAPPVPPRGWVLYDGICPVCTSSVERWGPLLRRRGFGFAALQTEWVRLRLGLQPGEFPAEMKLLLPDGTQLGGVDALIALGRTVWCWWPVAVLASWPGFNALAWLGYRWIARNRYCLGDVCALPKQTRTRQHHALTTFLELP
jgi:predicted DCC family thiol-disulfide oxidoreductase YuxK